ncbi:MAG TPA: hypothetical protein VNN10_15190 [Dehalococcoidia bacterium]|nr:hypothetical protein [Dehalococcoidia bacterium]
MKIEALLIFATVLILATDASAERIIIGPLRNNNPADVSSVSAECEISPDGRQMTCSFVQIRVDLVKTPEAAAAELEKQLREVDPRDVGKMCKDQRKDMADLAAKVTSTRDILPRLTAFLSGWLQRFDAMCDKPTPETIREFIWYGLQKYTRTCRIWANPWKETFIKQLGDKWVSNHGPDGICGVVVISTLESKPIDPKNPSFPLRLWTYETQKVVTDKSVPGPFCQLDETKARYSWDARDFDRSCDFVEL